MILSRVADGAHQPAAHHVSPPRVEIILTHAATPVRTNRELYGYGYDAYLITTDQAELQVELESACASLVKPLT